MSEHGCKWNRRSLVDEATGALLVSMRVAGAQAPIPINIPINIHISYANISFALRPLRCFGPFRVMWYRALWETWQKAIGSHVGKSWCLGWLRKWPRPHIEKLRLFWSSQQSHWFHRNWQMRLYWLCFSMLFYAFLCFSMILYAFLCFSMLFYAFLCFSTYAFLCFSMLF
jgi:hypothetical protein